MTDIQLKQNKQQQTVLVVLVPELTTCHQCAIILSVTWCAGVKNLVCDCKYIFIVFHPCFLNTLL